MSQKNLPLLKFITPILLHRFESFFESFNFKSLVNHLFFFNRSPEEINIDKLYGILINTVGKWTAFGYQFSLKLFRHWFSIKKINDHYYNLDSQLKKPEVIGNEADVCCYLKSKLAENNTELLLVVDKQVAEDRSWENRMLENEK